MNSPAKCKAPNAFARCPSGQPIAARLRTVRPRREGTSGVSRPPLGRRFAVRSASGDTMLTGIAHLLFAWAAVATALGVMARFR